MIKFINKLLILPLLVFSFYSCSKNDSSSETGTAALEGKWQYTKTGTKSNNQEILTNYQHTTGCTKDYIEILAGGILKKS